MNPETKARVLYENLDTTFVNLWALLRNLSHRGFIGRVHVELKDYTADIFLNGSSTPLVHEIDRVAGTDTFEEGALHRLVLRVRETPGTINVFEGADEAVAARAVENTEVLAEQQTAADRDNHLVEVSITPVLSESSMPEVMKEPFERDADETKVPLKAPLNEQSFAAQTAMPPVTLDQPAPDPQGERSDVDSDERRDVDSDERRDVSSDERPDAIEWAAIVKAGGELIGGVERAVTEAGADFNALFNATRLALADDYTFLDPMSDGFRYATSTVTLSGEIPLNDYVAGLSEALRRIVDRVATGDRARRLRERIALELFSVARKREAILARSGFRSQLDRIAGTKVI